MSADGLVNEVDCKKRHDELLLAMQSIDNRLFRDNGHLSIQTRLDRHDQTLQMLYRLVYGAVSLTLLTVVGAVLAVVVVR